MQLKYIAVIGAGTMGQGIAQWFLQQNIRVDLVDQNQDLLEKSAEKIKQNLDQLVFKRKITETDANNFKTNLRATTLHEISKDVDLVIEAIVENLAAKQNLFLELDRLLSPKTILATNTSSIPVTEIGAVLPEKRRQHFLGIHFFNPATIMKLVEIISGMETDSLIKDQLIQFFNQHQKVACHSLDRPGFIVNRVARNYYGEALRIVENYDLNKIKEVDQLMKAVGGFKMGPFELMDLIGIDVNLSVTESVYKAFFDEPRFRPHKLQKEMVMAKRLGKKTQKGFYNYES